MDPTRQIYWNIPDFPGRSLLVLASSFIPVWFIWRGLSRRWKLWRAVGKPEPLPPCEEWIPRFERVLVHVFTHQRLRRARYAGIMHAALLSAFILLFIGTLIVAFQADFADPVLSWHFFRGRFYVIYSTVLELAGLAGIAGCALALFRRYSIKPESLGGLIPWTPSLWYLLAILVSGFMLEGCRIAAQPEATWEKSCSFVGYGFSLFTPGEAALPTHLLLWLGHYAISIAFLCTFGDVAMGHVFTVASSVFLARDIPGGAVPRPIHKIEEAEVFGVLKVEEFRQSHLRDADSCVECGRCQDVCPAWLTGKPLSPKKLIASIRAGWKPLADAAVAGLPAPDNQPELVGGLITADEIWSCTTCGACERECPSMIEQIEKVVEMRRGLVLMKSEFPHELQTLFNNLERSANPWGKAAEDRGKWAEELDFRIPIWGEPEAADADYLFWVGCAGSFDARSRQISKAFARVLRRGGVKFAMLGPMETCTGDPALRIGNEYLYQMLAQQTIGTLKEQKVRRIVTACPHCFQTLGKDYREFDAHFEVMHHTQLIARLIDEGRLEPRDIGSATSGNAAREAVFHDSCYLARHNGVVEEPRAAIAEALNGREPIDPERSRDKGLCCGAGGGRMWMEEKLGHKQVNTERAEELIATGATTVVTACPFCKTMLGDGIKGLGAGDRVEIMDVAELLDKKWVAPEKKMTPAEMAR